MGDIINSEESTNVTIQKYQFGKLDLGENEKSTFDTNIFKDYSTDSTEDKIEEKEKEPDNQSAELLEKIELLTSQIVTLQMDLENKEKENQQKLEDEIKKAFEDGKVEGIKETSETFQNENDDLKSQLVRSITILDEKTSSIDKSFKNIEEDLVESAILIAKKVIKKEIENNSVKVTKSIASALIETLKNSTNLTLKVNLHDYKEISEYFNGDSIMIVADEAISRGGVIILSDDANIDGTISTRLEKAMELIGKE
jgi:flagellar assembly protein FliH